MIRCKRQLRFMTMLTLLFGVAAQAVAAPAPSGTASPTATPVVVTAPQRSATSPDSLSPDKPLIDISNATDVTRFHTQDATLSIQDINGSPALRIDYRTGSDFPNVHLPVPPSGVWDLSNYGGVAARITNAGASDVTVGLRIDNAGDWHLSPWNTRTATLAAGRSTDLRLLFGMDQYPLDPAHIVDMQLFLIKPTQPATLLIQGVRAIGPASERVDAADYSKQTDLNTPVTPPPTIGDRPPVPGKWVKTLDCNFPGPTLDTKIWATKAWWNMLMPDETQRYSTQNLIFSDGILKIKCEKRTGPQYDDPTLPTRDYTTGFITTYGKWTQLYGYFEARIKAPTTPGLWPAFWMMPDRGPAAGNTGERESTSDGGMEFDIWEYLSEWGPGRYNVAVHWDGNGPERQDWGDDHTYYGPTSDGWHTYGLLWEPGKLTWYCDGIKKAQFASARVGSVPEEIMINVQMGGWATKNVDDSKLPDYVDVAYVRAWQRQAPLAH